MWGRKDDPKEGPQPVRPRAAEPAGVSEYHIGKSIQIKGDVSSKEDLQVDGVVEGKIELKGADLRVGQTGTVRADVSARSIVIEGALQGNVKASKKIEIRKTGSLEGDIVTVDISIQEGATFRGSVDIVKRSQVSPEASPAKKKVSSETAARPESEVERQEAKAASAKPR